jgi:PhnB protein
MRDKEKRSMAVKPVPEGYHTVTPYLTSPDLPRLLEFMKAAFDAKADVMNDAEGNARHAEVQLGDSRLMCGQASEKWPARPSQLYLYVEDTDAVYARAMEAGAKSLMEPADMFYGDRNAGVEDSQGNYWWIATHVEDVSPEEMERRAAEPR